MGKVQQQEQLIYEKLQECGKLSVMQARELLGVSDSTVRRFFFDLESDKKAIRNYGGIVQISSDCLSQYSYEQLEGKNAEQKQAIAEFAVNFVKSGDTVYIDSGTTLSRFSKMLSERIESRENKLDNITVITNSLSNLTIMQKHNRIILIGGEFREQRRDFCGYLAEETLKSLRFTKCFLGSDGYSPGFGFTTTDFLTARLNEIVLENSRQSFVLMDSSKFTSTAVVSYSKNCPVDILVTDSTPPKTAAEQLIIQKTEVKICMI